MRELWLPEVGVSELFLRVFPVKIPIKRGDATGEPRVPRRSRSHYLSNAPGLADQLVASKERLCARRRLSGRKNAFYSQRVFSQILSQFARVFDLAPDVGFRRSWYRRKACAAYFCKVPDSRESELGLVRYGPANRGHRGVFGPFEDSFPIGIPARLRKTLRASVATSVGKFRNFQHSLILSACFHVRGRRSSPISDFDDLGIVGKLVLPTFQRYRPCTEASLGFARYDLANRGRWNVPYAKGSSSD
uniref:Uncharacterized protein n=1 Tax=Fagus sylvatica TaxID=28930 RepID=A0A2N9HJ64_FAGSY